MDVVHLCWRGLPWKLLPIRQGAEKLGARVTRRQDDFPRQITFPELWGCEEDTMALFGLWNYFFLKKCYILVINFLLSYHTEARRKLFSRALIS